jgi:beta-glucanase (GH16 family)
MKRTSFLLAIIFTVYNKFGQSQTVPLDSDPCPTILGWYDDAPNEELSGAPSIYVDDFNDLYLIWSDEFNASTIDYDYKWKAQDGVEEAFDPSDDWYDIWDSDNIYTLPDANGQYNTATMLIEYSGNYSNCILDQSGYGGMCYSGFVKYIQPKLESRHKFLYGRYEIRCKVPDVLGMNPSFWLFGQVDPDGSGFKANEIDIFEFLTDDTGLNPDERLNDNRVDIGLIAKEDDETTWDVDMVFPNDNPLWADIDFDFSSEMHTYTFDWGHQWLMFYVDGFPVAECSKYRECFGNISRRQIFPFRPVKILAQVHRDRFYDETENQVPDFMEVDYIRYYGFKDCGTTNISTIPALLNSDPDFYNYVAASQININGNLVVPAGTTLSIIGDEAVNIGPGLDIVPGSNVTVSLDYGMCSNGITTTNIPSAITPEKIYSSNNSIDSNSASAQLSNTLSNTTKGPLITISNLSQMDQSEQWSIYATDGRLLKNSITASELAIFHQELISGIYILLNLDQNKFYKFSISK